MVTIHDLATWKAEGRRFPMLTAYDFPTAKILDEAGIPVLLVGDSVGNNVLGYPNTLPVTMEEMLHHTRAVVRGATNALIVGDMPFLSYQPSLEEGVRNAGLFIKGGAHAVKVEGAQVELTGRLTELGIPVMGHVGLTPQFLHALGGYRVQGRTEEAALRLRQQAEALEKAGIFSLVLDRLRAQAARARGAARAARGVGLRVRVPARGHEPQPLSRDGNDFPHAFRAAHVHLGDPGARDRDAGRGRVRIRPPQGCETPEGKIYFFWQVGQ